jgi:hypothetical protein
MQSLEQDNETRRSVIMAPPDPSNKGANRTQNCWHKLTRIVLIAVAFMLLAGCGNGDLPE